MTTELFKLTLAFRGLSDEDEEDAGIDNPDTIEEDDDDDLEVDGGSAGASDAGDDDDEPALEE